jgi:hypothetical protein
MNDETYPSTPQAEDTSDIAIENPPIILTFTAEQQAELQGTILEGSRGLSIIKRDGQLIAEQLA